MAQDSASDDFEAELNDFVDGSTPEEAAERLSKMTVWENSATAEEIVDWVRKAADEATQHEEQP